MESSTQSQRPKLHPLVATAAGAVILLSVVGIGTVVMNRSSASPSPDDAPPIAQSRAPATSAEPARATTAPVRPSYVAASTSQARTAPATRTYEERPTRVAQAAPAVCHNCGVVDSISDSKVNGEGTGLGGVGGAVVGGLLGNQIGGGRGKTLATVAGAVGGAFAGNAIEKNVRGEVVHRMVVRLDDGSMRTFTQANPFGYGIGERVRIVDGHVERG